MTKEDARERVCEEMDWWRNWMFERVKESDGRNNLFRDELIVCAILATASLAEARKP